MSQKKAYINGRSFLWWHGVYNRLSLYLVSEIHLIFKHKAAELTGCSERFLTIKLFEKPSHKQF